MTWLDYFYISICDKFLFTTFNSKKAYVTITSVKPTPLFMMAAHQVFRPNFLVKNTLSEPFLSNGRKQVKVSHQLFDSIVIPTTSHQAPSIQWYFSSGGQGRLLFSRGLLLMQTKWECQVFYLLQKSFQSDWLWDLTTAVTSSLCPDFWKYHWVLLFSTVRWKGSECQSLTLSNPWTTAYSGSSIHDSPKSTGGKSAFLRGKQGSKVYHKSVVKNLSRWERVPSNETTLRNATLSAFFPGNPMRLGRWWLWSKPDMT